MSVLKTPAKITAVSAPTANLAAQLAASIEAQVAATVAAALAAQKPAPTPAPLVTPTPVVKTVTPVTPAPSPAPSPAPTPAATPAPSPAPTPSPTVLTAVQIAAMTSSQIKALTSAQLASLGSSQIAGFSTADIASLSPTQIASLSATAVAALSSQQIGALTGTQLGAFSVADIHALSTAQLGNLTGAQIAGFSAAQINAMSASQLGSLQLNYNSMLALLQTDAVGGMNAAKFSALQTLASKLNAPGGISVSPYVQQIADDVILGNAANAKWTGGGAVSVPLGNLSATSSQGQVDDLIGKWFLGTDLPSSSVNLPGAQPLTVTYAAITTPLFAPAGPSMNDVNQGALGDCFVLAPLAEMAAQDPSSLQSMITANGNNSFSVRFFVDGTADYITVNNVLADGGKIFNSGPAAWAGLIEQAYTELQGGGGVTGSATSAGNSFASIGKGGWIEATLEEFTGAATINDFNAGGATWTSDVINGASLAVAGSSSASLKSSQSGLSGSLVQTTLISDLSAGDELVLSSNTNAVDSSGKLTLIADHALAVYGYDAKTNMFEVYNPWGTQSGQYWDTSFEVSLNTLLADGDSISVATNIPASGGSPGLKLTPVSNAGLMASASSPFSGFGAANLSSLGLAAAG